MQLPDPLDPVVAVKEKFDDAVKHVHTFRNEVTLIVDAEQIVEIMLHLRNTPGLVFNFLSDISSVDYYPNDYGDSYDYRPERYAVSYHLYSMLYNRRLRVKVFVMEEDPVLPTITDVWPAANWLEREIADLMGIRFEGHPDPRRLLLPDDWEGHPLRRDVPMGKERVQFSFNAEEIMKYKPFAQD